VRLEHQAIDGVDKAVGGGLGAVGDASGAHLEEAFVRLAEGQEGAARVAGQVAEEAHRGDPRAADVLPESVPLDEFFLEVLILKEVLELLLREGFEDVV